MVKNIQGKWDFIYDVGKTVYANIIDEIDVINFLQLEFPGIQEIEFADEEVYAVVNIEDCVNCKEPK